MGRYLQRCLPVGAREDDFFLQVLGYINNEWLNIINLALIELNHKDDFLNVSR